MCGRRKYELVSVYIVLVFVLSCGGYQKNSTHQHVSNESIRRGEELAKQYCQSCHQFPDPSLLDSKTWDEGVLPGMGPMLGIYHMGFQDYPSFRRDTNLRKGFYPDKQVISTEDWQSIIDYYTSISPDSLDSDKDDQLIQQDLKNFSTNILYNEGIKPPLVSLIKFDTSDGIRNILFYDVNWKTLYRYDSNLKLKDSIISGKSIVDFVMEEDQMTVIDMVVMTPNNGRFGLAKKINIGQNGKFLEDSIPLIKDLQRPVQIELCDLNEDGQKDYLICEYGNMVGSLAWYENKGKGIFEKHLLKELPGSIKIVINDINKDGRQDIIALFAQGDESIYKFINIGRGNFQETRILRFPPVYGSTSIDIKDMNHDGYFDVIYTCGDNADYSNIFKPYHGVYIYLNDGMDQFTQKYFFHLNGCFKVIAEDFDHDGDMDLSTISHFADYEKRPEESFVYFENKGKFSFSAYALPDSLRGKWLTMDVGDIDGDGGKDIILGNFIRQTPIVQGSNPRKIPEILILKNNFKLTSK